MTDWEHLWERLSIEFDDFTNEVRILRLHLLHVLQTVSPNIADLDVGVPARGLSGEAYRGHIFWDELFIFPVLNLRLPMITRSLLGYRYRRLPEARDAARAAGHAGAMFPWQSGSDGREESQRLHLNPRSGHWNPDASHRAHHIGIAVAYNLVGVLPGHRRPRLPHRLRRRDCWPRSPASSSALPPTTKSANASASGASSDRTSSTPDIPTHPTTASTTTRTPT